MSPGAGNAAAYWGEERTDGENTGQPQTEGVSRVTTELLGIFIQEQCISQ